MTRIGRGVIGIAVAVGLAVGLGAEPPGAGAQGAPPIRVGFSSAMTGPSAITGEGVKWAAQMVADEYNAKGGIAGRRIELYFGDNAGTPGEAVSAVRKLADVDKVDACFEDSLLLRRPMNAREKRCCRDRDESRQLPAHICTPIGFVLPLGPGP